jgi:RecA-family ATPase
VRQSDLAEIVTRPSRPPDWLLPGILHRGTIVVLAGQAGIGKSVLSLSLAVAKATGYPFLGRDLEAGRVLYFDEENSQPDFEEYLRWAWRGLGRPPADVLDKNLRMERFSLSSRVGHWQYMVDCAREHQPEFVVIDTCSPACQIKDENDNAEATQAVTHLRLMQAAAPNSTVLALKHAKIDIENGTYTVRGAKAWVGATDATLFHLAVPGKPRTDGLRDSQIVPEKIRAFGLRAALKIKPSWVEVNGERGLSVEASI